MSTDTLKDVPEFFETTLGESVMARSDAIGSFRELGPPDLCHITKKQGKEGQEISLGSYHHVSGVDASTMASLAAYINTLTYSQNEQQGWFGKTSSQWRFTSAIYCCYNAFSRVDTRVIVQIPGGVECYMVDSFGHQHATTPETWTETYLSALLRAILFSDDHQYRLTGFRRFDPIPTLESEQRFLDAAVQMHHKSWQLGTEAEVQIATNSRNHLTTGLLKYLRQSNRYHIAIRALEKLFAKDPEAGALLAESYIGMDEEIRGVRVLHDALLKRPSSYTLLHVQVEFLRAKGKYELAAQLAKRAVNCAPSEFVTWAKLTEIYIDLGDFKSALLTMNSCPMFTYTDRDMPRAPPPARFHALSKPDALLDHESEEVEPATPKHEPPPRLPAAQLRGTFLRAYTMLTQLAFKIGWEELLRTRSKVFVMEEEYRMIKNEEHTGVVTVLVSTEPAAEQPNEVAPTDSGVAPEPAKSEEQPATDEEAPANVDVVEAKSEDDLQEVPLSSASNSPAVAKTPEATDEADKETDAQQPVDGDKHEGEKVKSEDSEDEVQGDKVQDDEVRDDEVQNDEATEATAAKNEQTAESEEEQTVDTTAAATSEPSATPEKRVEEINIQKPEVSAEGPPKDSDSADATAEATDKDKDQSDPLLLSQVGGPLSTKRLCERWLDNLFMVLYEDLRAYAAWQMEMGRHKEENVPYLRSPSDWEALGELALRLQHKEAAKDAYSRSVRGRFSLNAWTNLLTLQMDAGDALKALEAIVRLAVYHDSQYNEVSYPMPITHALNRLVRAHGLSKVKNMLVSMNLALPIQRLVARYLGYIKAFQVEGWDL